MHCVRTCLDTHGRWSVFLLSELLSTDPRAAVVDLVFRPSKQLVVAWRDLLEMKYAVAGFPGLVEWALIAARGIRHEDDSDAWGCGIALHGSETIIDDDLHRAFH